MVHCEIADDTCLFWRHEQFVHDSLAVARKILHQAQGVQRVANRTTMQVHAVVRFLLVADGQLFKTCDVL